MKLQVKLTDLYNTRYFYITFQRDLVYLFSTFLELQNNPEYPYNIGNELLGKVFEAAKVGTSVEFDLANAKITPDALMTIKSYAEKGIVFIDTKDAWRDSILKENRRRISVDKSQFVALPLYDGSILVKDYIVSLDNTKTYVAPNGKPEIYIPLLYILQVTRPKVAVDLEGVCTAFFRFVGNRLTLGDLDRYTEFYFTSPEGTMIVDFSQGQTYIQRIGMCDIEHALTAGTLVPTVLGREKLLNDGCWRGIFKTCLSMLNNYRATRKQTLEEILQVKE